MWGDYVGAKHANPEKRKRFLGTPAESPVLSRVQRESTRSPSERGEGSAPPPIVTLSVAAHRDTSPKGEA